MCPDHQLLSAFFDEEVPSPWRERIADHVATCPSCASALQGFSSLRRAMGEDPLPDEAAALARIKARLESHLAALPLTEGPRPIAAETKLDPSLAGSARDPLSGAARDAMSSAARPLWWRRNLRLPLPLAAAAGILVLALGGTTTYIALSPGRQGIRTASAVTIPTIPTQSTSMEDLLHYLDSRDAQVTLTFQMPSGTTFEGSGSPVVMRGPSTARLSPSTAPAPAPATSPDASIAAPDASVAAPDAVAPDMAAGSQGGSTPGPAASGASP